MKPRRIEIKTGAPAAIDVANTSSAEDVRQVA